MTASRKLLPKNALGISSHAVAHHLPTDICQTDPEWAVVAGAWDRLPQAVRAGIVAMVKASTVATEDDAEAIS
jgi:hypothetical protein